LQSQVNLDVTRYFHEGSDPLVRLWGKWCGPNWTANQVKPAQAATKKDRLVPCNDELDCACKRHDLDIRDNGPNHRGDMQLKREAEIIVADPYYLATNPEMYFTAQAVIVAMDLVQWTR